MSKYISLKSKLVFMLLGIALSCIIVIGYQGLYKAEQVLTKRIYDQLTSVREGRRSQVENWYQDIQNQIRAIAVEHTTLYAMREFSYAFEKLNTQALKLDAKQRHTLENYYKQHFFPKLHNHHHNHNHQGTSQNESQENLADSSAVSTWLKLYLPQTPASQRLQMDYLANNPHPTEAKADLLTPKEKNYYNSLHKHYHPVFRQIQKSNDFYDLFLIDLKSGDITYSVSKEVDYATNLKHGVYRTSNLGKLFRKIADTQNYGEVLTVDFDFYKPSYGIPAMFMGTTIFDFNQVPIGILVVQVSLSRLNNLMTGYKGWRKQGLGETGETFLVGEDLRMRSNARRLYEDKVCYAQALHKKHFMDADTAQKICHFKTSVLLQAINDNYIQQALKGHTGTETTLSYNHEAALVAYSPLLLGDMKWAIIAQMDKNEANIPIHTFQKELGISAVIIASIVTTLATLLAILFVRPLEQLMSGFKKLGEIEEYTPSSLTMDIPLKRSDEYGELAKNLNTIAERLHKQQQTIKDKETENNHLLLTVLPEHAVRYYKKHYQQQQESKPLGEWIENVSVIYVVVGGMDEYTQNIDHPEESLQIFSLLFADFDRAAHKYELECIKTLGNCYLAAGGISVSQLDYAKHSVDFAKELLAIARQYNYTHTSKFSLRIAIHSGMVLAGIVGRERFSYDLWGETLEKTRRLALNATENTLLISEQVYTRLHQNDADTFQEWCMNNPDHNVASEATQTWVYQLTEEK